MWTKYVCKTYGVPYDCMAKEGGSIVYVDKICV